MSLPRYVSYKDSGEQWLGETPSNWDVLFGKRLFANVRDSAQAGSDQLAATQAFGVIPQKEFMEKKDQKVVLALSGTENFRDVQVDDFVISLRSFQGGIEHSAYVGCVSPAYTVLRMKLVEQIHPKYFKFLLKEKAYISALQSVTSGIREGRTITYDQFASIQLPVPTLEEQCQIGRFLTYETVKIDTLIEQQQRLIELLKEKRQAVISHAVTKGLDPTVPMKDSGVEWLGEVPAHWEVRGLTKFIGPVVDYRGRTPTKVDDGIFLVTARNIKDGRIDYGASQEFVDPDSARSLLERGSPEIGDLLFTMEAPLGQVALIDKTDIALAQRIVKFRGIPSVMSNHYLLYWLMSSVCKARLETLATGSTALGIKASKLGMIECLGPTLPEQAGIVGFIERELLKNEQLTAKALEVVELLQERRSALISAAVTGKIDVRNWKPPVSGEEQKTQQEFAHG